MTIFLLKSVEESGANLYRKLSLLSSPFSSERSRQERPIWRENLLSRFRSGRVEPTEDRKETSNKILRDQHNNSQHHFDRNVELKSSRRREEDGDSLPPV